MIEFMRQSFQGIRSEDSIRIPNLDEYMPTGDDLYIHPISGVVTPSFRMSEIDVANYSYFNLMLSQD